MKIIAAFNFMYEDKYNCFKRKEYLRARNMTEQEIEKSLACKNNPMYSGYVSNIQGTPRFICDNILYYDCFCQFFDTQTLFIFSLFQNYEKGILPFNGCLVDQPSKIIEMFDLIHQLKTDKMEIENRKERASLVKSSQYQNQFTRGRCNPKPR